MRLSAKGHMAKFIDQFEWEGSVDFKHFTGTLVATGFSDMAATVLFYSGRIDRVPSRRNSVVPVPPLPSPGRYTKCWIGQIPLLVGNNIFGSGAMKNTKTQRHGGTKKTGKQRIMNAGFLCASVPLCLCVFHNVRI